MAMDLGLWSPFQPAWSMHRAAAVERWVPYKTLKFKTSLESPMNNWEGHKVKGSCWLPPPPATSQGTSVPWEFGESNPAPWWEMSP